MGKNARKAAFAKRWLNASVLRAAAWQANVKYRKNATRSCSTGKIRLDVFAAFFYDTRRKEGKNAKPKGRKNERKRRLRP
jgi:hypothetical protein